MQEGTKKYIPAYLRERYQLLVDFEKAFEITIPEEEAQKIATVGDAIKYIEAQKK